jgi:flagellar L-ring protein precursor FlgH
MNTKTVIICMLICFISFPAGEMYAGSIWAKKGTNAKDRYADDVARKIGDVLTITINEVSDMTNTSERDMSKVTSRDQQFDGNIGVEHILPTVPAVKFGAGTSYTNTFESEADNKNQRAFIDNITVVVIDIMPNGNLVIHGTCKRNISDDIQEIEVSGIVRPSDIDYNNTVNSKRIANFNIITKYKGAGAPFNKPGWLGRILDILWPF